MDADAISTHILTKRMTGRKAVKSHYFKYFNSHPHEEDDMRLIFLRMKQYHFNSHPHEEDDTTRLRKNYALSISTHILTKRMTDMFNFLFQDRNISTHILTKRMTGNARDFNDVVDISTHILTKRMTKSLGGKSPETVFQLTSSRRG